MGELREASRLLTPACQGVERSRSEHGRGLEKVRARTDRQGFTSQGASPPTGSWALLRKADPSRTILETLTYYTERARDTVEACYTPRWRDLNNTGHRRILDPKGI